MKTLLLLLAFPLLSFAQDFNHLTLSPVLQDRLRAYEDKSLDDQEKNQIMHRTQAVILKTLGVESQTTKSFDGQAPNMSPVMQKIVDTLNSSYRDIGKKETDGILNFNRDFNMGSQNFSGFTWQKPMGQFAIGVNREIRPFQFTDIWIVEDTFTIFIDAVTFLKSLKEENLISITDKNLGLFAGVTFKRQFRFEHFANSYNEGLISDFSKLFLAFNYFSPTAVFNLAPYEIISKEDMISAQAGGVITSPSYYGISASAGVLAQYKHIGKVRVQKLGAQDAPKENEILRIDATKGNTIGVGVSASVQIDILKLLKLTLFSYDLEYNYTKTQKVAFSFYEQDKALLLGDSDAGREFRSMMTWGIPDFMALKNRIVSLEQRENENMNSKFAALLFGSIKKKDTEQIKIIKDNSQKVFFRTHFENLKIVQNFFSRIFNIAVQALVKFDIGVKNAALKSRSVAIEYEADERFKDDIMVESEEKLSVLLQKRYEAKDTTGFFKKSYKEHTIQLMSDYTALTKDFVTMVRKDELQGPLVIYTNVRIGKEALEKFNQEDESNLFKQIAIVCESKRPNKWADIDFREDAIKRPQIGNEHCVKQIGQDLISYKEDFRKYKEINLKKFRDFMIKLHKETDRIQDLHPFFGEENIYFNGYFQATTKTGNSFQTFFKDGIFRGLGIVDDYIRGDNRRMPASVISE